MSEGAENKRRDEERRIVLAVQKILHFAEKTDLYCLRPSLAHFYPDGKVPELVREAVYYWEALMEWAAILGTKPEKPQQDDPPLAAKGDELRRNRRRGDQSRH